MMKTRITVVAVALSFMGSAACFAANPHMGAWKLNEAKSKLMPGMGKNITVVYAEMKDKMKVTVDGVDKDGKVGWTGQITVAADGKSRTVTINGTDANGKKFKGKAVYDKA